MVQGKNFTELVNCVACNGKNLKSILDLGNQPLANDFVNSNEEFETYPLKLMHCVSCSHSQISVSVDPSRLFRDYSYVSSTSETLDNYFDLLSNKILLEFGPSGKVLDIGSNDGSFLVKFLKTNWASLGIDPAINLIPSSLAAGVLTLPTFFNESVSKVIASDFDVIVAMNIFAHTSDPLEILLGMNNCLKENGLIYIQTSQADMFLTGQFDTVYHEHISFFNIKSMKILLERAGLYLKNATIVPIHGGSYLWEISKSPSTKVPIDRQVYEERMGFYTEEFYRNFSSAAEDCAQNVKNIVEKFRQEKYSIVSYGAAAKGNTFINFSGIKMDYIFDDTPQKIGKRSPAGGCQVSNPENLRQIDTPLLIVCPAWNFREEILRKVKTYRTNENDQFLTYFPEINLINLF
jgi:SAM-dependent methyltransferase